MIRIFLVDGLPGMNKGEIAILEGMINSLHNSSEVEVAILSHRPETDAPRYPPKARAVDVTKVLPFYRKSRNDIQAFRIFWSFCFILEHLLFSISYRVLGLRILRLIKAEIWKTYVDSDILMAHDGSFGIGGGKPGLPVFLFQIYLPLFAKMIKKPIVLYAVSINKPYRFVSAINKIYRCVLNKVSLITLREETSYQYLLKIGVLTDHIITTADSAFLLEPSPPERIQEIIQTEGIEKSLRPIIGITVTREIASGISTEPAVLKDNYNTHTAIFARLVDKLIKTYGANIIFVPHCIGFDIGLDDRIVAREILAKCENKSKIIIINNEYGAAELKGLVGQFDLFIGERMHALIGALSMGVPSIAIIFSTDQRSGIIRMMGQEQWICYAEELTDQVLISKVSDIWAERNGIREELISQTELVKKRAMLNGVLLKKLLDARDQRREPLR